MGGPGPWRAAAGRARRDHATRGLRAHRRQARGRRPARSTARPTSRSSASRSTCPRSTSARSPPCCASRKGRLAAHASTTAPAGPGLEYLVPARGLDRVPDRAHDRDPWHGHRPPRVRGLGAVGRRDAPADERRPRRRPPRSGPRLRHRRPPGPLDAVRRAGRRGLRGHDRRARTPAPRTWTSTSAARRSRRTSGPPASGPDRDAHPAPA